MQRAVVIGLGVSGLSAADFLLKLGHSVHGYDDREATLQRPEVLALTEKGMAIGAPEFTSDTLVVTSPGLPPSHPLLILAQERGCEIVGEAELAFRHITGRAVAITGTCGKTTVTLMVAHILNGAGIPAIAVGNVGLPLTSQVAQINSGQIAVVELSSFQLETLATPILDAALFLNLSDNHLDHHPTYEAYGRAKCRIQCCLKRGKPLYIGVRAYDQCRHWLTDGVVRTFGENVKSTLYCEDNQIISNEQVDYILPVAYRTCNACDMENLLAAYALCREMGVEAASFFEGLSTFRRPPHRQEWLGEWGGVRWVNDSKGTTPVATLAAVKRLEGPIVLIAGGVAKGANFREWAVHFPGKVRKLLLLGEAADQIEREVGHAIGAERVGDLCEAVERAAAEARAGELVLLSPGCASYDMFSSYVERGERFKQYVDRVTREGREK